MIARSDWMVEIHGRYDYKGDAPYTISVRRACREYVDVGYIGTRTRRQASQSGPLSVAVSKCHC